MSPNPAVLTWPRQVAAGGGGIPATLTDQKTGAGTQASLSVDIGTAAADRFVLVALPWRPLNAATRGLSNITIGGATPPLLNFSAVALSGFGIFGAPVPTGTTTTLAFAFGSGSTPGWRANVYTLSGDFTLEDFEVVRSNGSGTTFSATVDCQPGDLIIGSRAHAVAVSFTAGIDTDDSSADTLISTGRADATGTSHTVTGLLSAAGTANQAAIGAAVIRQN